MAKKNQQLQIALCFAALLFGIPSALAQTCETFDSYAPGLSPNPWVVSVGGGFPTAQMQFSAPGSFEVWAGVGGPFPGQSLRIHGFPSDLKIIGLVPSGLTLAYPTSFTLDVADFNGDATVAAYDPSGKFLASYVAPWNTPTHISFSGLGQIGYVYIFGNQNEMWIDNVCIQ